MPVGVLLELEPLGKGHSLAIDKETAAAGITGSAVLMDFGLTAGY